MWSTGVILYSLFTGSLPFGSDLVSCSRFRYDNCLMYVLTVY
jgi:serine/threonine protein kinase